MRVGILGSGDVGVALVRGFIARGDDVMIGSRNETKRQALQTSISNLKTGDFAECAIHGEIIILATNFKGAENALKLAGTSNLAGKVLIDTTNPLKLEPNQPVSLAIKNDSSAGESVQGWAKDAKVVKAFNSVGNALMVNPKFQEGIPTMFICGNDDGAKKLVSDILDDFGWEIADIGDITESRWLEPLCILWVHYGMKSGSWNHAFKLLRK